MISKFFWFLEWINSALPNAFLINRFEHDPIPLCGEQPTPLCSRTCRMCVQGLRPNRMMHQLLQSLCQWGCRDFSAISTVTSPYSQCTALLWAYKVCPQSTKSYSIRNWWRWQLPVSWWLVFSISRLTQTRSRFFVRSRESETSWNDALYFNLKLYFFRNCFLRFL